MHKTKSKSERMPIPSDKDLAEIKQHNLNDELKELLYGGQGKFDSVAKRIQENFSYDQLAIIVANQIIGTQKSAFEITLTGENSNNRRGGHGGGRSNGGNRGGNRGGRSFSGGGNRGRSNGGDRRGGSRSSSNGDGKRSYGGNRGRSNDSGRSRNSRPSGSRDRKSSSDRGERK